MGKNSEPDKLAAMRRFARRHRDGLQEADPFLCRHLRARSWYAPEPFADRETARSSPPAPYWCLRTMRPDGPDGARALPEDCTDERSCFEPAVVPRKDS